MNTIWSVLHAARCWTAERILRLTLRLYPKHSNERSSFKQALVDHFRRIWVWK